MQHSAARAAPCPDLVRVTGIAVTARHGVFPEEKVTPQLFVIDLACALLPRPDSDDLATTVDYAQLATRVARVAAEGSVDLIETLAERVAATCLAEPMVAEVEVTVHKPEVARALGLADLAVTITRRKQ